MPSLNAVLRLFIFVLTVSILNDGFLSETCFAVQSSYQDSPATYGSYDAASDSFDPETQAIFGTLEREPGAFEYLLLAIFGIIFVPFAALIFTVLTIMLGWIWPDFETSGPENWRYRDFYSRYLVVAGVFTFVTLPITFIPGLIAMVLAFGILAATFYYVFDGGWLHAIIVGGAGGAISLALAVSLIEFIV